MSTESNILYSIPIPKDGFRTVESFTREEAEKLLPIAETLAMMDGNAFFTYEHDGIPHAYQYLPEAHALYEANGGDGGWAGEASFVKVKKQELEYRLNFINDAFYELIKACESGKRIEHGVGGMTLESQLHRTTLNRIPAIALENAYEALGEIGFVPE